MILLEFGIPMYQFKVWGLFYKKRQLYWSFLALILISWLVESIINNNIFDLHFIGVNIYTKSLSAFLIGILSIHQLNKVVLTEKAALFTNSKFLICCGFLISFIYLMFQSIFQLYESTSNEFLNKIIVPFAYGNIFVNVFLFLGAVYFIPKKKRNLWLL
ncbi:hypothetical protein [Solitalea lacus]|uniref:hypothetical protein n=1 Tax=Solitalea lacus TaxID=2911172 RepID=UPI001EDA95F2|nr:hypothetical protein [Solitalea lacus]UKJ06332.1 hypothetical protein L2B55_12375 [Solitalea lacus]